MNKMFNSLFKPSMAKIHLKIYTFQEELKLSKCFLPAENNCLSTVNLTQKKIKPIPKKIDKFFLQLRGGDQSTNLLDHFKKLDFSV